MMATDLTYRWHSAKTIDHFSELDGTVRFYSFVHAILRSRQAKAVLDFGAGRGEFWHDDVSVYRRHLRDLRADGAVVTACDVDPVVQTHPCSDHQVTIQPGEPLPFASGAFDVIVSDNTFEHIASPAPLARELLRVLKPGGFICARTTNQHGYVRLLSGLVPNRLHAKVLDRAQKGRKEEDVFPTVYKLNSPRQVARYFENCEISHFYDSAEPAYFFGSGFLYGAFTLLHKLQPARLSTTLCVFIRKLG